MKDGLYKQLAKHQSTMILQDDETRFCNSCNLAGYVISTIEEASIEFKNIIPRLISVCRDLTGNKRKNAAIFLAKLAKNPDNLVVIR